MTLTGGSQISSLSSGAGQGGSLTVTATDCVTLSGISRDGRFPSGILASAEGQGEEAGDAGTVVVTAKDLMVASGAQISSSTIGAGQGGNATIRATDSIVLTGIAPNGTFPSGIFATALGSGEKAGNAGTVDVKADNIMVTGGAAVSSVTLGQGKGGTVTVTAADTIVMSGQGSGLFTGTAGRGLGGDIILAAQQVQLTQEAIISAESSGDGNAGNIRLAAQDVALRHGSAVTTTARQGDASGGNILIGGGLSQDGAITEGVKTLTLDGSRITANTDTGGGANMTIGAQRLILDGASAITANTGNGAGGNLRMARAMTADGAITARADAVVLHGSQMTANTVQGTGGRIDIVTEVFLIDPASAVDASSQAGGIDGEVNVEAVVTNLSGIVTPRPQNFASATLVLRNPYAARLREGKASSLVVAGRDGIPGEPEGGLPSPLLQASQEMAAIPLTSSTSVTTPSVPVSLLSIDNHGQLQLRSGQRQGLLHAVRELDCALRLR